MTVQNLSAWHHRDCRVLFESLNFSVNPGDKLAIIGEEGNGKSTLLKLLYDPALAENYADWEGTVSHKKETLGYFPQEEPSPGQTVGELTASLTPDLYADAMSQAFQMGLDTGVLAPSRLLSSLSGGERVKLRLAILVAEDPDILLLDEPTNDLDLDTLLFLEDFLADCPKTVIFTSHDPDLLTSVATAILHLELTHRKTRCRATFERTDYLSYMASRGLAIENQTRIARKERADLKAKKERWEEIYRKVDSVQTSVSRRDPGAGRLLKKKMHTVKAMEHRLEREEANLTDIPDVEEAIFARFAAASALPDTKVILDETIPILSVGDRILSRNLIFRLVGNQKAALTGPNGCGKTTLLRYLFDRLQTRCDIKAIYLPQDLSTLPGQELDPVSFMAKSGQKEELTRLRTCLGSLKYTAEEMSHPFSALSGGQKAKLVFLKLCQEEVNVLLLDEPTRNLSPLSAPVIRELIASFPGAVIAVTHDRALLRAMHGQILRLTPDGLKDVSGSVG